LDAHQKAVLAATAAADKKAADVVVLEVGDLTVVTDYFVIASGANPIQVKAIVDHVLEELEARGFKPLGVEGYTDGRWVLLDFGDVVVHVMNPEQRDYYGLERLWGDARRVELEQAPS